jgi:hypothetical protein
MQKIQVPRNRVNAEADSASILECWKPYKTLLKCIESKRFAKKCLPEQTKYFECRESFGKTTKLFENLATKDRENWISETRTAIQNIFTTIDKQAEQDEQTNSQPSPCWTSEMLLITCGTSSLNVTNPGIQGKCLKATRNFVVCQLKTHEVDDGAVKFSTCYDKELPSKEFYTPKDLTVRMMKLVKCLKPESE